MTAAPRESSSGRFGRYGGRYVPETLVSAPDELARAYDEVSRDDSFATELSALLRTYAGRPTPLSEAPRFSKRAGRRVLRKREDRAHTGAHKINNTMGQGLPARRIGKRRIIAETGAGQHGVATATACARLGLDGVVCMGEADMKRQRLNVFRMELLGARVIPVTSGTRALKDATNEALRDWVATVPTTHYVIGSVVGPDPFPRVVRDFQGVIGQEARERSIDPLSRGRPGVPHGSYGYPLQTADGQVQAADSISAGLDYPGVGPEHAYLHDAGRVRYECMTDRAALAASYSLAQLEGILPALESAHALAWLLENSADRWDGDVVLVNLSGRGDKDVALVAEMARSVA